MSIINPDNSRLNRQLRAFLVWRVIEESEHPLTIAEIARACSMSRSAYLADILEWLWLHQFIAREARVMPNGYAATVHWATGEPTLQDLWDWSLEKVAPE